MKIVILDGYTLNPGDLLWDGFKELGDVDLYDRTPKGKVVNRIGDAEIVITNKTELGEDVFEQCPNIKYIGVLATGYNVVDVQSAKAHNISVTNVPTYGTTAVAQFVFALLLEMAHHVKDHSDAVKQGRWASGEDFCFWDYPLIELKDKVLGVIGFGRIGQATAKIALAFGMKVLAFDKNQTLAFDSDQIRYTDIQTLLKESDVISLHCPLLPSTEGIIRKETISQMKDGVMIINTSRGPLIVEEDLRDALVSGKVAHAALDVLSVEPASENNPLLGLDNCFITPHIAWAPRESRARLMDVAVRNLKEFIAGNPINVVNK